MTKMAIGTSSRRSLKIPSRRAAGQTANPVGSSEAVVAQMTPAAPHTRQPIGTKTMLATSRMTLRQKLWRVNPLAMSPHSGGMMRQLKATPHAEDLNDPGGVPVAGIPQRVHDPGPDAGQKSGREHRQQIEPQPQPVVELRKVAVRITRHLAEPGVKHAGRHPESERTYCVGQVEGDAVDAQPGGAQETTEQDAIALGAQEGGGVAPHHPAAETGQLTRRLLVPLESVSIADRQEVRRDAVAEGPHDPPTTSAAGTGR